VSGTVIGADALILLKSEDFPTLGLPTIATMGHLVSILLPFLADKFHRWLLDSFRVQVTLHYITGLVLVLRENPIF
jgi:hypothetical protein